MSTSEEEIKDKIADIVRKHMNVSTIDKKDYSADILNELEADSLDAIEILMEIEEEFDIDIEDQYAEKFISINITAEYIKELII